MVATTVSLGMSITDTVPSRKLATYAYGPLPLAVAGEAAASERTPVAVSAAPSRTRIVGVMPARWRTVRRALWSKNTMGPFGFGHPTTSPPSARGPSRTALINPIVADTGLDQTDPRDGERQKEGVHTSYAARRRACYQA